MTELKVGRAFPMVYYNHEPLIPEAGRTISSELQRVGQTLMTDAQRLKAANTELLVLLRWQYDNGLQVHMANEIVDLVERVLGDYS